jgi:hypothetical protein
VKKIQKYEIVLSWTGGNSGIEGYCFSCNFCNDFWKTGALGIALFWLESHLITSWTSAIIFWTTASGPGWRYKYGFLLSHPEYESSYLLDTANHPTHHTVSQYESSYLLNTANHPTHYTVSQYESSYLLNTVNLPTHYVVPQYESSYLLNTANYPPHYILSQYESNYLLNTANHPTHYTVSQATTQGWKFTLLLKLLRQNHVMSCDDRRVKLNVLMDYSWNCWFVCAHCVLFSENQLPTSTLMNRTQKAVRQNRCLIFQI